ncbi:hypothetical protein SLS56_006301 [Neofusicoccum ribis]|uniref:Tat pathway signal sequence n=1 Tax=Neofusicoccum ribis TaxID=45134 RepID=A0ABR3SR30_9PEZI
MDQHNNTKYSHVISSEEQHHAEEKESLMLRSRLSEETDSTLLEHVDLHDDDRERGISSHHDGSRSSRRCERLGPVWLWALHAGLFFISIMFFALGATMGPTTTAFVEQFSAYLGDQMVTEADMAALGKPHNRLRVTDEATGESGWRMELAVVHQLHCLNLIRKVVHKDHYEPLGGDLAVPEEKLVGHLNHCIEALRMKIMCEADVGVILYREQPGSDGKMEPDYETQHVCRNWDTVREWAVENKVADKTTF